MSPTPPAVIRCAALAAALLLTPLAARAGDDDAAVSVVAVYATDQNDKVEPGLECIAKEIRKDHPKLTGFRGVMTKKNIAVGGRDDFDLGGDLTLRVAVQQKSDKDGRYQVKISPPQMGDITYLTTCCGRYLPVVTPVRNKDNELLILCVCVQPCNGK